MVILYAPPHTDPVPLPSHMYTFRITNLNAVRIVKGREWEQRNSLQVEI